MMEVQNPQQALTVEIQENVPGNGGSVGGTKACGEGPCGFSNVANTTRDAKERSASMRKLLVAVALCVFIMSIEIVGGILANSLAIFTDVAHLVSDIAAFAISLFSLWAAGWEATPRQTYGFYRAEILGALLSIQLIWLLAGILIYEAIARIFHNTKEVNGKVMFGIAAFGFVVNIFMALLLGHDHAHGHDLHDHNHNQGSETTTHHIHHHHHVGHLEDEHRNVHSLDEPQKKHKDKPRKNINVQGAYLHALGDCIQSLGVMIGGGIIWYKPEWKIVDLICTLIFSIIVLGSTIKMLRQIFEVLMESTPREIDTMKLRDGLLKMKDVLAIHELHIWAITMGKILLACHVKIKPEADGDMVLDKVIDYIRKEYNIDHITIQIER